MSERLQEARNQALDELQQLCYRIGTDPVLPDKYSIRDLKDLIKDAEAAMEMCDDPSN